MNRKLILMASIGFGIAGICGAQTAKSGSGAPYNEGSVWVLTFIKTKAGLDDDYFRQITGTVKPVYEEEKKQKLVLDYKILTGESMGRDDFNIIIMVAYPNMAVFDGLREKTDSILEKVMGNSQQQSALATKRLEIREIIGVKTMREITLK